MKIVVLTNVFPNRYGMSDGMFVYQQAQMLSSMGHSVDVLYIDLRSVRKRRKWGEERYTEGGVRVFHYSVLCGPLPAVYELLYQAAAGRALKKYIKRCGRPDIIHGHFYINGTLARKVRERYQTAFVLTEHSSELYEDNIRKWKRRIIERAYAGADCLIAVSEALKKRMRKYTDREIEVIPNVLSGGFAPAAGRKKGAFQFVSVGHVIESKGMRLLVQGFEQVQEKLKDVKLVIVGDGALREELEREAKDKGLGIEFTGEVAHERLPGIFNGSHVFVLPSERETFGVSYVEAMAAGLPVIATRCGGPEEFVNSENGVLIRVNDRDALALAMTEMYKNYTSYDSAKISGGIMEKYGQPAIGQKLERLYERCKR